MKKTLFVLMAAISISASAFAQPQSPQDKVFIAYTQMFPQSGYDVAETKKDIYSQNEAQLRNFLAQSIYDYWLSVDKNVNGMDIQDMKMVLARRNIDELIALQKQSFSHN